MPLILGDDLLDSDTMLGPLPNFNFSFEKFFIEKAANLLICSSVEQNDKNSASHERVTILYSINNYFQI